jgi:hypothetical protein
MKTRILVWGLLLVLLLSAFAACDSPSPLKSMSDEEKLAFFNEITADYRENGYRQSGTLTYERKLLNGNKFDTLEREETFSFTVLADDGELEEYLAEWERSDIYTPADKSVKSNLFTQTSFSPLADKPSVNTYISAPMLSQPFTMLFWLDK